jgi:hypothetical protein
VPPCVESLTLSESIHLCHQWLSFILHAWPSCPKIHALFLPRVLVFPLHLPPRRVIGAKTATKGVTGTKNTMANVDGVGAVTVVATTRTEMVNEDVIAGVAVTVTKTVIEVEVTTAAMATVTMTVGMRIATATRGDPALSGMIALLCGLRPHRLGLPLAAQVPHTMTTPGDILPRHRHLQMTDPDGQAHHLRMLPLGTSRKTCTEGTVGWTEGVIISNGTWVSVSA